MLQTRLFLSRPRPRFWGLERYSCQCEDNVVDCRPSTSLVLLKGVYTIQQTSSKRPALARVFWIHLLEVCWTFAESWKHPIRHEYEYGTVRVPVYEFRQTDLHRNYSHEWNLQVVCTWTAAILYTQTRVCRNSYTEIRTVPDFYSFLCECSLSLPPWLLGRRLRPIVRTCDV